MGRSDGTERRLQVRTMFALSRNSKRDESLVIWSFSDAARRIVPDEVDGVKRQYNEAFANFRGVRHFAYHKRDAVLVFFPFFVGCKPLFFAEMVFHRGVPRWQPSPCVHRARFFGLRCARCVRLVMLFGSA